MTLVYIYLWEWFKIKYLKIKLSNSKGVSYFPIVEGMGQNL